MAIKEDFSLSENDVLPLVKKYLGRAIAKNNININKTNFNDSDIEAFSQAFFDLAKENFNIEDERLSREIGDLIPLSRAYHDPLLFISSAVAFYYSDRDFPDEEVLEKHNIYPDNIRGKSYTPITMTEEDIKETALEMADIIDYYDRNPIIFAEVLETYRSVTKDPSYSPYCIKTFLHVDSGTNSRQNGTMTRKQMSNVISTKITCNSCPLKKMCLASSIAVPQTTRMSQKEIVIPTKYDDSLTMLDYLMYGGYTPQERRLIFEETCRILIERDNAENVSI